MDRFITVDGLVTLMERTQEPKQTVGGFEWASRQIAGAIEPQTELAASLRNRLANLIWRGREDSTGPYSFRSRFNYLAPALAKLCNRQLSGHPDACSDDLVRACVIASRFGNNVTDVEKSIGNLRAHFNSDPVLRKEAFWAELAFMDEIAPDTDDWDRYHHAKQYSLMGYLTEADRPWLEAGLADESRPERKAVVLHALISIWRQGGEEEFDLDVIRGHLKGEAALVAILEERTAPPTPEQEATTARHEVWCQQQEEDQAREEAIRLREEEALRGYLLTNADEAFSPGNRKVTLLRIYSWLQERQQAVGLLNDWDNIALTQAFGPDTAERAENALMAFWRAAPPVLWSAKPPEAREVVQWESVLGLIGVSREASTSDWAAFLSSDEVRTAAAYATVELNSFASFIAALAKSYPGEVEDVIGGEVSAELGVGGDHDYLPTLQHLTHADRNLKQLLIPRLLVELKSWPYTFTDEAGRRWALHLDRVLRVLDETKNEVDREAIADECAKRYETDPVGAQALVWLRALFRFDAVRGTRALLERLADGGDTDTREQAVGTFAALFSHSNPVVFEIADRAQQARVLERLVRCAYAFIRPEDDQSHEGVFTPDTRDDAESARNFLLSRLLDMPGLEAYRAVMALAEEDNFAHFPDRLRLLARQRAATDAEFPPYGPEDVLALEIRYEVPPRDRDGLFDLMMDRLEDIAHYYAHGDFSNRRTIRTISDEPEMQRTLAERLKERANGTYSVSREEEVADGKETDIRLSTINGDQKAVVEVKIADNRWSLTDFKRALHNQLVGQYLRDANCKAGCLLLTCHDAKKYWIHPDTKKRINFAEIIAFLNEKATTLEEEKLHDVRVAVYGLDLTDPPRAPDS